MKTLKSRAQKDVTGADVLHVEEHSSHDQPPKKVFTWGLTLAVAALSFSFIDSLAIYLMAVTIITDINADIGPNPSYTWMASGYTVAYAVSSLLYGSLADLFGRRWFAISTGLFLGLGSLIAAVAQNVGTVIAGMVIMGFAGAGGIQCVSAISEIVPTNVRGPIVGLIELPFLIFTSSGSYFAHRMVVDTAPGWRTVYWIGLASGVFLSAAVFLTYRPELPLATRNVAVRDVIREFDYLGLVGISAGMTLILMGIIWEPQYGSTSAHFLAPLICGTLTTIATGFQQVYFAKRPILHPFLWRRFRTFTLQAIVVFVSGMLFYSLQALYPQFMALCFVGNDPVQIGISQLPLGVATVGGVISGMLLPWLSRLVGTNAVLAFGVFECALFIALLAVVDYNQQGMAMGLASAATFGIGWTNLLSIPLIQLCAPDEWIGFATGLRTLMSLSGGSVATSVFSTIFAGRAAKFVPNKVSVAAADAGLPAESIPALIGVLTGATPDVPASSVPGLTPEVLQASQVALQKAYLSSFRYVWYSSIPFGAIALIAAAYTKDLRLS